MAAGFGLCVRNGFPTGCTSAYQAFPALTRKSPDGSSESLGAVWNVKAWTGEDMVKPRKTVTSKGTDELAPHKCHMAERRASAVAWNGASAKMYDGDKPGLVRTTANAGALLVCNV